MEVPPELLNIYKQHENTPLGVLSGFIHGRPGQKPPEGKDNIEFFRYPPGCCMVISRKVYESVGKFDECRLIRTVDTSYMRILENKGYRNARVWPKSLIEHTGRNQRSWVLKTGKPILMD